MSYATRVREEIYAAKPSRSAHYRAFCYGLILFGRRFDARAAALSTEHLTVSKLYGFAVRDAIGVCAAFTEQQTGRGMLYHLAVTDANDVARLLQHFEHTPAGPNRTLTQEENASAFVTGAFLACGTISEPSRGYHLEFVPSDEELSDLLFEVLSTMGYPPKSSIRRGATVLYYKESEPIEDLLTMMGAVKCSLELMELKIYKDLRNRANRSTNCETANIDKMIKASRQQMADIALLRDRGELSHLPTPLVEMASLREKNPQASLAELASLTGTSRSGVNHRLMRLGEAAARLRDKEGYHG